MNAFYTHEIRKALGFSGNHSQAQASKIPGKIFEEQKLAAEESKREIERMKTFREPIVTRYREWPKGAIWWRRRESKPY